MSNLLCSESIYLNKSIIWGVYKSEIPVLQVRFILQNRTFYDLNGVAVEVENLEVLRKFSGLQYVGIESVNTLLGINILQSYNRCSIVTISFFIIRVGGVVVLTGWVDNVKI